MELLEKTLDLYSLLSAQTPDNSKIKRLESLLQEQTPKVLNKSLAEPDPFLEEKMSEYMSRLKGNKISFTQLLEELENLEMLNHKLEKSKLLLKSFQSLSPDLNLAKIQLAEKKLSINN